MTIREAIAKVIEGQDLTEAETAAVMGEIMAGEVTPVLIASLLTALRMKGAVLAEVVGAARALREKAVRIAPRGTECARPGRGSAGRHDRRPPLLVDTCGTGGGSLRTFNISTTAAFVVAGAGVPVAKHGNRGMTSTCGSADVLEALGVNIAIEPSRVADCIDEVGIGFMFAQAHHPAMKYAAPVRRELGFRTLFNLVAPLTNPAGATAQVVGVFQPEFTELLAQALGRLGCRRAFVVHGLDGLDELSTLGATRVSELKEGVVTTYELHPGDVGLTLVPAAALADAGDPAGNAALVREVLEGEPGPRREIVLLNAAAALVAAGVAADLRDGIARAAEAIDAGHAAARLRGLVRATQGSATRNAQSTKPG
jgi:anthranilate phosphoribosyltransferase